jgi:hypothetical protein
VTHIPSPSATPSINDPGDDTARRFAYQWTYAGILICALLDDTLDVVEVFCEHHEDVLVKHRDGTYTGVQVKTRDIGGDPWTATEDAIFGAVCKFVYLEQQYPGQFRCFVLATNHTFLSNKTTSTCLPHVLALAEQVADEAAAVGPLKTYLTKLSRATGHPDSVCLAALKKCKCDHSLPKLDHVKQALASTIVECWDGAADIAHPALIRGADGLIAECQRAASLDHAQSLPRYLGALTNGVDATVRAAIEGKRIDAARLAQVLSDAIAATSLLAGPATARPAVGLAARGKLDIKLDAGGFSAVSVTAAKDLRDKAEYKSLEWMNRLGETEGLRRHEHIRTVVLRDCADAHEAARAQPAPFGVTMLQVLRSRFRQRRAQSGAPLFDSLDEHLEGHAYSLTNECKVWWSEPFAIPEGA